MKQVLVRAGKVEVLEVPSPAPEAGRALVSTAFSLISAGTERMALGTAGKSSLERAVAHPSPLKRTGEILREEGVSGVIQRLRGGKRNQDLMELGYSASGVIRERGEGVTLPPGTRVACAGSQFAHHAELISVPQNLMAPLPEEVSLQEGAFATLGAIALHAFRRSGAELGETVALLGLGLVGQLGAQIARASGGRVVAFDPVPERVDLARTLGIDGARVLGSCDPGAEIRSATNGHGADVVLVFAGSPTNEPLTLATELARKKAKIVVVGEVKIEIDRSLLYAKELDLLISTSYGPGRYDVAYEESGHDYPLAYVRWTEARNLEAVLALMAEKKLRVQPLIERIYPVVNAGEAYQSLRSPGKHPAVLLEYSGASVSPPPPPSPRTVRLRVARPMADEIGVAVVGPGSFMKEVFIPALQKQPRLRLDWVVGRTGGSARAAAERFSIPTASTDLDAALADDRVGLVVIGTRHHLHAEQTIRALQSGKAVFVEKPLCLNRSELERVAETHRRSGTLLAVGFNRRYAPLVGEMKKHLHRLRGPRVIQIRVNAGFLPAHHWSQDPQVGGGRLVGEGCHFVDLVSHLAQAEITQVSVDSVPSSAGPITLSDNFSLNLRLSDGSVGSVVYTSLGDLSLAKERVEVHASGCSLVLDDFRELHIHHSGKSGRIPLRKDKGVQGEVRALTAALRGEANELITWEEIESIMSWTLRAQEILQERG